MAVESEEVQPIKDLARDSWNGETRFMKLTPTELGQSFDDCDGNHISKMCM